MKSKRILLIIMMLLLNIMFINCKKGEKTDLNIIISNQIFNQKNSEYLVCFTDKDNKSLDKILKDYTESTNKDKVAYNVYVVKDLTQKNSVNVLDGIKSLKDIKIKEYPTLVKVTTVKGEKEIKYVCSQLQNINNYLNGLLSKYKITYKLNGGKLENDVTKEFSEPSEYVLPTPTKNGYVFGGWYEDNKLVTELDSKSYKLEAKWVDKFDYTYIEDKEIFNQKETNYLVYFMKDDCPYCEKIKNTVLTYIYLSQNSALKLYVVNLKSDGLRSDILRQYTGIEGESDDKDIYVDGVTKWNELYISGTPTLIKISEENNERYSRFITIGATNVSKKLWEILSSKDKDGYKVNVNYDNINLSYSFESWERIVLPKITKDGLTLVCYEENGQVIDYFVKRNYELKPVWGEYEFINDTDIFDMPDDKYLVYFMKNDCPYCEGIKQSVLKYIYKSSKELYKGTRKLYVVNLKNDKYTSTIYKTFNGSTLHVDNATTIDDLYIAQTPTLIEINKKVASLSADSSSSVVEALENYLVVDGKEGDTQLYEISFEIETKVLFEGVYVDSLPTIKLHKWQTLDKLPEISMDGFYLLGWLLGEETITSINGQNAIIKPLWASSKYYEEIEDTQIFNQKENRYFVYFMKDGCTYCEKAKPKILEYASKANTDKYKNSPKVYVVNLKKNGKASKILREYKDNDSGTFVDGAKKWDELYIPSTPTLIEISGTNPTAKLAAIGTTNVVNILNSNLTTSSTEIGEKQSYTINIDLDYENKKISIKFFNPINIVLPKFDRDGYVYAYLMENDVEVTAFEKRNYNLKVKWIKITDYKSLNQDEVFNGTEDSYYILFVKEDIKDFDEIIKKVIKAQYQKKIPIYVIDATKATYARAYIGSDGEGYNNKFYVSKSRSLEDLYIYATPCIIKINKGEINQIIATFSKNVSSTLDKFIE